MRIWKIVSGILSIAISLFVVFQSFFAGMWNILSQNGQSSGTAGVVVAITLLTGGIVAIATHNGSRGGDIAMAILYGIGAVIGFVMAGDFADLAIWAAWCALCAFLALLDIGIGGYGYDDVAVSMGPAQRPQTITPLKQVILERNPKKRNAAIDALPEREAKNYLKQVLGAFFYRMPLKEPEEAAEDEGGGILNAVLIALLAVMGVFVLGLVIYFAVSAVNSQNPAGETPPPAQSQAAAPSAQVSESPAPSAQASESPAPSQTVPVSEEPTPSPQTEPGALGDYFVEIRSAVITQDYDGNPAILITYNWTNNSDATINAMTALTERAFQDGVQLDTAILLSSNPQYTSGTSLRDLRPGASTDVQCAFLLPNAASPVEFEVYEFMGLSDEAVTMTFDPAGLTVLGSPSAAPAQ